jgi:hypothetical protein
MELQRDGRVDRAMAAARKSVLHHLDWWLPVLFLRVRHGMLWQPGARDAGSAKTLLRQAYDNLAVSNFVAAQSVCEQLLSLQPGHPEAHLLAAVALLGGYPADKLMPTTLQRVEAHLKQATAHPSAPATVWAIWGVVRYDAYYASNLAMGQPPLPEIRTQLEKAGIERLDLELLHRVKHSADAAQFFGLPT